MHPVGRHEHVTLDDRAVGQHRPNPVGVLLHGHDLGTEPHVGTSAAGGILEHGGERRPLQGEGDAAVLERDPERDVAQVAPGGAVHPVHPARGADCAGVVEHPEHRECVEPVGRHGDPGPLVGVERRAALEHRHVEPEAGCSERDGRTGDASADDE